MFILTHNTTINILMPPNLSCFMTCGIKSVLTLLSFEAALCEID